jgi:hypothetical protein
MARKRKPGRPRGSTIGMPSDPAYVRKIVQLRDKGLTFAEIAEKTERMKGRRVTKEAIGRLYGRWAEWAAENSY